jgi:hypothetical protein
MESGWGVGAALHGHERPVHAKPLPVLEKARAELVDGSKKATTIKDLGVLPRNCWKFGRTVAFLLDSQAKNP